jgi:anti-sigma factor RsiW
MDVDNSDERQMGCAQLAVALVLAADGELSREDRLLLETHLAGCPACRTQAALFDRADRELLVCGEALDGMGSAGPDARARLIHRLVPPKSGRLIPRLRRVSRWQWAAVAGVSLAAAVLWIMIAPRAADRQPFSSAELQGGNTEVIRVELPLSPVGDPFLDGSQSESVVLADVVFGSDGLPRTVRLAD